MNLPPITRHTSLKTDHRGFCYRFLQINSFPAQKLIPAVFGKIEDARPSLKTRSTPPHKQRITWIAWITSRQLAKRIKTFFFFTVNSSITWNEIIPLLWQIYLLLVDKSTCMYERNWEQRKSLRWPGKLRVLQWNRTGKLSPYALPRKRTPSSVSYFKIAQFPHI